MSNTLSVISLWAHFSLLVSTVEPNSDMISRLAEQNKPQLAQYCVTGHAQRFHFSRQIILHCQRSSRMENNRFLNWPRGNESTRFRMEVVMIYYEQSISLCSNYLINIALIIFAALLGLTTTSTDMIKTTTYICAQNGYKFCYFTY